jgi:hypothetical protein
MRASRPVALGAAFAAVALWAAGCGGAAGDQESPHAAHKLGSDASNEPGAVHGDARRSRPTDVRKGRKGRSKGGSGSARNTSAADGSARRSGATQQDRGRRHVGGGAELSNEQKPAHAKPQLRSDRSAEHKPENAKPEASGDSAENKPG